MGEGGGAGWVDTKGYHPTDLNVATCIIKIQETLVKSGLV